MIAYTNAIGNNKEANPMATKINKEADTIMMFIYKVVYVLLSIRGQKSIIPGIHTQRLYLSYYISYVVYNVYICALTTDYKVWLFITYVSVSRYFNR